MSMQKEMSEILEDMEGSSYDLVRFNVDLFKRTYLKMIEDGEISEYFIREWMTIAGGLRRRVLLVDDSDNVVGHINGLLTISDNINGPAVTNLLSEITKKVERQGLSPKTAYNVFDKMVDDSYVKEPFVVLYGVKDEVVEETNHENFTIEKEDIEDMFEI